MYINSQNQIYVGDMRPGDREATSEEIAAREESRTKSEVESKLSKVRKVREAILGRVHGIKDAARDAGDSELVSACSATRFALLDITTGCPADPELVDAFILGKYAAIVATLPESLVKAFAGVDA
jgi:hypothetical protein